MKRFLSALLCAVLLLGLLPAVSPPARMLISYTVTPSKTNACPGDSVTWTINETLSDSDNVKFHLFLRDKDNPISYSGVSYFSGLAEKSHTFILTGTGTYFCQIEVTEPGNPFSEIANSVDTAVTLRPAPKDFKVEAVSGTALKLTWVKVAGATGYEIWRRIGNIGEYKLFTTTTALCFSNTYLTAGTRYYYQIRAYNLIGTDKVPSGSFSAARAGVPLAKSVITSAVGVSTSQIKLNWTKVPGATGYQILRSTSAAGTYQSIKLTTTLTYTVGGMQSDKTYYFKVRPYKKIYTATYYGPLSAYRAGKTK